LHQFDVVGAFGDAGIDERLGILGPCERGNGNPVLGAAAAGGGDDGAGGGHRVEVEHVEVGRASEGQGGLEAFGRLNVDGGVDEAGEEALARGVDDVRAGGEREVPTGRLDFV